MTDPVFDAELGQSTMEDAEQDGRVIATPNLPIAVADFALSTHLGRDIEMSFFAVAPTAVHMSGFRDDVLGPAHIQTDTVYVQTGRIRMPPSSVAHMVINCVLALHSEDKANFTHLKTVLTQMFANEGPEKGSED